MQCQNVYTLSAYIVVYPFFTDLYMMFVIVYHVYLKQAERFNSNRPIHVLHIHVTNSTMYNLHLPYSMYTMHTIISALTFSLPYMTEISVVIRQ